MNQSYSWPRWTEIKQEWTFVSPGPRVTLINDSYFWDLIPTLSVIKVRGCVYLQNHMLHAWGYSTVWCAGIAKTCYILFCCPLVHHYDCGFLKNNYCVKLDQWGLFTKYLLWETCEIATTLRILPNNLVIALKFSKIALPPRWNYSASNISMLKTLWFRIQFPNNLNRPTAVYNLL